MSEWRRVLSAVPFGIVGEGGVPGDLLRVIFTLRGEEKQKEKHTTHAYMFSHFSDSIMDNDEAFTHQIWGVKGLR